MKYDVTVPSGLGEFSGAASPPALLSSPSRREGEGGSGGVGEKREKKKHRSRGKFDGVFEEERGDEEDEKAHLMIGNVRVDFNAKEEQRKARNEIYWEYDNGDAVGGDDSDEDEEEEEETEEEDEDSDLYSSSISDEEEYERQLKAIAGMALDGDSGGGSHMVPSPGSSFGESSSSSDDWTSKKGRQKAIAKKRKAKRAAQEQLIEEEELETYVESVLETLMYLGEGSYIGLPPGMTKMKLECVRDIVNQRSRSLGFLFETVGGGKRIHAVIRLHGNSSAAQRSVMSYYGKESRDKKGKNRRNTQQRGSTRKAATPVSFIKAGEATDLTRVESSSDDDDDTSGEPKVYANRGLRRAAEAEAKAKALRRARKKTSKGVPVDSGRNYADFEKYGNGIGSKLMEKMGFTHGTGLGAKRDGKAEPVEAVMRKKRAGLGT